MLIGVLTPSNLHVPPGTPTNLRHGQGQALEIVTAHPDIESFYLSTLMFPSKMSDEIHPRHQRPWSVPKEPPAVPLLASTSLLMRAPSQGVSIKLRTQTSTTFEQYLYMSSPLAMLSSFRIHHHSIFSAVNHPPSQSAIT